MCYDRLEILDTNDQVKIFFGRKVCKLLHIDCNRGVQWLLQNLLFVLVDIIDRTIVNSLTIARHDLLSITSEAHSPTISTNVELFGARSKIFNEFSECFGRYGPFVIGTILRKNGMHGWNGLEGQAVSLQDS